ncbi:MAG: tRNA preQ1(34) S-adenosylmethionine ribosyltransferase-isomerase QueA [Turicibacter sp.]|nr:tRNA preQ1(34) S-adenosylmethionine ribosyltransferase-isomerase QueA [Turicibacter sp.]
MNKKDFYYNLPKHLIAHSPLLKRTDSRLMLLDRKSGTYKHQKFTDILELLKSGDCLVINDTKVIPARLFGQIMDSVHTNIEMLLHREIGEDRWEVLCKPGRKCKPKAKILLANDSIIATVESVQADGVVIVTFEYDGDFDDLLNIYGAVPLPPYIKETSNLERYNTVYAENKGSVAAPTAGLHFTHEILKNLQEKGVNIVRLTLHVGLGTFRPVNEEIIENHRMHREYYEIPENTADIINRTKSEGGRIIAVGTTCCRTLETCADDDGFVRADTGNTDIFIYPGHKFKAIDGLLTNFHIPESTLIMLVSAFCGRENILKAYEAAVAEEYRFYSFGDAMLIL